MQNNDCETRSAEDFVTPTEKPEDPVAVGSSLAEPATESASGATTETATVSAEFTPQRSGRSRLRSQIGSLWHRLREQRREAAAVIVLIVIAMVWSDTGSSGKDSAPKTSDPLDSYEAVLSDFAPVDEVQAMPESADPFESSPRNSFDSGLYFPQSEESALSNNVSAGDSAFDSGRSMPATTARYPETSSTLNASATHSPADYGSDQQQRRRVKFAGRIQPAN
ncbi:MAG: hypothetical protein WKF77_16245 [Planctomycetaceae bacterium]